MCQAAGLDTYKSAPKINNTIFETPIEKHLEKFAPRPVPFKDPYPDLASISDIHWPFVKQPVVDRFHEYNGDVKPRYIILDGDAHDMYSHAKFPRTHNLFTPREEQAMARKMNEDFWIEIKKRNPNAECVQMLGNHDLRALKRILEAYPEAEDWISEKMKELFTFPGVKTVFDPREEFIIGNIAIFHGYRSQLGSHRDYTLLNVITGHTHRGGVVFRKIRNETLWELNCGYAGDPEAKGLTYTPQRITEWTHGFGIVNKYGPQFIHC